MRGTVVSTTGRRSLSRSRIVSLASFRSLRDTHSLASTSSRNPRGRQARPSSPAVRRSESLSRRTDDCGKLQSSHARQMWRHGPGMPRPPPSKSASLSTTASSGCSLRREQPSLTIRPLNVAARYFGHGAFPIMDSMTADDADDVFAVRTFNRL